MDSEELIGVVTVTYNSSAVLPDFLRCMMGQSHANFLLFAVDNASDDETLHILGECRDNRLRIISNSDNRGVATGNNQGIHAALEAGCITILLINNDTEFQATLIAKLSVGLLTHDVDMTCPKIMYFSEPERIWAAGGTFEFWHAYRSIHAGEGEVDKGQYDNSRLVSYVPTCCVLIRRKVFETVGLMDERYFVYWDDTDFMYRAMKAGIRLMYLPEATVLHKVGSLTGGDHTPFAVHYGTRNSLYFLLKHFGPVLALPWLVLSQMNWCRKFLSNQEPKSWFLMKQRAFRESLSMWRNNRG